MKQIEESEIIDLEEKLVEYIKRSDIEGLDKVLHDKLLFIAPNGAVVTKAMDIASHKAGDMVVNSLILKIEQISIIEDNAIAITIYDTSGTMLAQPIQGQFKYVRIWKKFANGLKVIGGSCIKL